MVSNIQVGLVKNQPALVGKLPEVLAMVVYGNAHVVVLLKLAGANGAGGYQAVGACFVNKPVIFINKLLCRINLSVKLQRPTTANASVSVDKGVIDPGSVEKEKR